MCESIWSIPSIAMSDYDYDLPADRIALHPSVQRDQSRLLVCDAVSGRIEHRTFAELATILPDDSLLVLNDTRVVRARIIVHTNTGGRVELFLLEPIAPSHDPAIALAARGSTTWRCMIGGARRARSARRIVQVLPDGAELAAAIRQEHADGFDVEFTWTGELSFADVLDQAGRVPLPPYIKRETEAVDDAAYQTVYADAAGSVAAPTAGLHFTPKLLEAMAARGMTLARVTLHVGAGTFRQVKSHDAAGHDMHHERVSITASSLARLIEHARRRDDGSRAPFVVVGTTSLRTVESLYWFGVRLLSGETSEELLVDQWDPYRLEQTLDELPGVVESLEHVERWRSERALASVDGVTRIMIVPGYRPRMCDALVTNFHQPASTLLLLVGALLGRDRWRAVYDEALAHGYRFLSYGDASLLILQPTRFA